MTKATKQDTADDPQVDARAITTATVAEQPWARGEFVTPVVGTLVGGTTASFTVTATDFPTNTPMLAQSMLSLEVSTDQGRIWHVLARGPWVSGTPLTNIVSPYYAGGLLQGRFTVPVALTCGLAIAAA